MNDNIEDATTKGSLIHIEDPSGLSKPLCKLLDVLSAGCGKLYEPIHTKRIAKANAKVHEIEALSRIQLTDPECMAMKRQIAIETQKCENLDSIARLAVKQLPENVSEKPVDQDWATLFTSIAERIGSEEMQLVWAKLLAGEVAQPGAFSKLTLRSVETMSCEDAELFNSLATYVWHYSRFSDESEPSSDACIPSEFLFEGSLNFKFHSVKHLAAIGLIQFESIQGFNFDENGMEGLLQYHGRKFKVTPPLDGGIWQGCVILTQTGSELFEVTSAEPNSEYVARIIEWWQSHDARVEEISA